jgi:hypothetical protein
MRFSLALAALLPIVTIELLPASANAQRSEPVVVQETTSQASGPSMAMVGSGIVIFGLSYVPAVVVGSSSGLDADRTLLVPIAGPWIDLTQRPGCNGSGSACNQENTNKVLLVTDGVFQGIGVLTVVGGFLTPAHERTTVESRATRPTWHLAPVSFGAGAYGMAAAGTF